MSKPYILVVDDEPDIRSLVQEILEDEGYDVGVADSGKSARDALQELTPQLLLLDIWMPDEDGISLLKDLKRGGQLDFPVVMISGHGTVETAVEATRHGAVDFIEKPLSLAKLLLTVEKALQYAATGSATEGGQKENSQLPEPLIGSSQYIQSLQQQIRDIGATEESVLIVGEQASGKSLIAKHIHAAGKRANRPFIQLRCDSLSSANSSRELLGESNHGSLSSGYLEAAAGGTLFLVDVEQLPEVAQSLLLEVIEKREFRRIGSLTRQQLDVRLIASSAEKLPELVRRGDFSAALYNELSSREINCKPLRDHPEDIPVLLDYYVNWFVESESLPYRHFTVAAQNRLRNLDWPGNLLELKNLVQRLMILGSGVEVDVPEINEMLGGPGTSGETANQLGLSMDLPLREARAAFERAYMLHQLQLAQGNIGELAKRVGMERTHLYRKLRSLEIDLGKARD
ncbi:MAG: sigma-54-dependent Fis family transcriptional regulator [Gammaproteobacteria bacterium]|nr:sigma-54-dependent Fis family transcriptional regulator [Gammaproteobacteria bacterium]